MSATLPKFSRGLKLARIGVILMLVQLAMTIVMTVKLFGAKDASDVLAGIKWLRYALFANGTATTVMVVGTVLAIPELAKFRVAVTGMIYAAIAFLIATLALVWIYFKLTHFIDVALDPEGTATDLTSAMSDLELLPKVQIAKDLAYGIGLIALLGMVQRSAAASDQLTLRDDAGHHRRAIMVMVAGDLFYQLTFGASGGGLGLMGIGVSLLVLGYWIYCHVKLTSFLGTAAHFMNEPHDLPVATVVKVAAARPSAPPPRPSQPRVQPIPAERPSEPLQIVKTAPVAAPAPVRPPTEPGSDVPPAQGPRFLR